MVGDDVTTRLEKEVSVLQQEVSKRQEELARLDTKMETRLQVFKEEFKGELHSLFGQYLGHSNPATGATAKRKGVLGGPPPGFAPKDSVDPTNGQVPASVSTHSIPELGSVHFQSRSTVLDRSSRQKFD
ncbi:hypothetical protein J1N35_033439 [Gossypium stocksii]|uniref:Uncharacterized protein n=1 Tax=Gossypium stocksii TaxID=47602 RepID=A0A9D3ZP43_9ROSI|nr:hypothetical protein J1N35_033439 [Gossypium stocksii]